MHAIITCGYVLKTISQFVFLGKSNGSQGNVSILYSSCAIDRYDTNVQNCFCYYEMHENLPQTESEMQFCYHYGSPQHVCTSQQVK